MAAPAHYIRSIHTSFTAAHPPSSAWSSAASRSSQQAHVHLANLGSMESVGPISNPVQYQQPHHQREVPYNHQRASNYNQVPYQATGYNALTPSGGGVSINTHNHHSYTHHLQNLAHPPHHQGYSQGNGAGQAHGRGQQYFRKNPPGLTSTASNPAPSASGAGGRRRSASIRVAPASYAPITRSPPAYKFDPFADDPVLPSGGSGNGPQTLSVTAPLTSSSQANKTYSNPKPTQSHPDVYAEYTPNQKSAAPYTIHIPAAAPLDIQLYSPPLPRPAAKLRSLSPISGPNTIPTSVATPVATAQAKAQSANLSRIVAGILLNRAHTLSRPMRRRVLPRLVEGASATGYRKSCLSSVVSVDA